MTTKNFEDCNISLDKIINRMEAMRLNSLTSPSPTRSDHAESFVYESPPRPHSSIKVQKKSLRKQSLLRQSVLEAMRGTVGDDDELYFTPPGGNSSQNSPSNSKYETPAALSFGEINEEVRIPMDAENHDRASNSTLNLPSLQEIDEVDNPNAVDEGESDSKSTPNLSSPQGANQVENRNTVDERESESNSASNQSSPHVTGQADNRNTVDEWGSDSNSVLNQTSPKEIHEIDNPNTVDEGETNSNSTSEVPSPHGTGQVDNQNTVDEGDSLSNSIPNLPSLQETDEVDNPNTMDERETISNSTSNLSSPQGTNQVDNPNAVDEGESDSNSISNLSSPQGTNQVDNCFCNKLRGKTYTLHEGHTFVATVVVAPGRTSAASSSASFVDVEIPPPSQDEPLPGSSSGLVNPTPPTESSSTENLPQEPKRLVPRSRIPVFLGKVEPLVRMELSNPARLGKRNVIPAPASKKPLKRLKSRQPAALSGFSRVRLQPIPEENANLPSVNSNNCSAFSKVTYESKYLVDNTVPFTVRRKSTVPRRMANGANN